MSQPTRTEVNKIGESLAAITVAVAQAEKDIGYLKVESMDSKRLLEKYRDEFQQLQSQVAVIQANLNNLRTRWDESDRRRWTVYGVMLAASLTFVANLVLLFLKR